MTGELLKIFYWQKIICLSLEEEILKVFYWKRNFFKVFCRKKTFSRSSIDRSPFEGLVLKGDLLKLSSIERSTFKGLLFREDLLKIFCWKKTSIERIFLNAFSMSSVERRPLKIFYRKKNFWRSSIGRSYFEGFLLKGGI